MSLAVVFNQNIWVSRLGSKGEIIHGITLVVLGL